MLSPDLLAQLRAHADKIKYPIVLASSLDDSFKSADIAQFLDQIASISKNITVERRDDSDRRPFFRIERAGTDIGVGFAALPLGHEFTSLVLALLQVGGHPPRIDDVVAEEIRNLDIDAEFETFMSLSCQNCPDVVQALNMISILNPRIKHSAIDGALFKEEAEERSIMAVPTVMRDGEIFHSGRVGVRDLLARLDAGSVERAAAALAERETFDVLVVGGGPAGNAAAVYTARKGLSTAVVTDRLGGQLLETMAIENFISVPYTEGPKLAAALGEHAQRYDVETIRPQRAKRLIPAEVEGGEIGVELESGPTLKAKSVVLATGARWRKLGVPGEEEYLNKGVAFCPHCDGPVFAGKDIAVIGGGNSGVEAAIDLAGIVKHVTLLEFQSDLLADEVLQAKLRSLDNVEIITDAATTEIVGDRTRVTSLKYDDRVSGESHEIELAGLFVQIGLMPNTDWLKDTVELTNRGEIIIDERGQTSLPGVVAAGDCTTQPYKQIIISMGSGATAALTAFDHLIRTSAK